MAEEDECSRSPPDVSAVLDRRFARAIFDRVTRPQHTTGNRIFAGSFERANPEQSGDAKQRDPRGRLSCRRGFRGVKAAWSPRLDFAPRFSPHSHLWNETSPRSFRGKEEHGDLSRLRDGPGISREVLG